MFPISFLMPFHSSNLVQRHSPSTLFDSETGIASREVCDFIQDEQNEDFKKIWSL
jgi:hypothetical protein